MADEWMTLEEAAAYLKVSKPTIYRLTSDGRLSFYKLAGTGGRRFKRSHLDALLTPGNSGEMVESDSAPALLPSRRAATAKTQPARTPAEILRAQAEDYRARGNEAGAARLLADAEALESQNE